MAENTLWPFDSKDDLRVLGKPVEGELRYPWELLARMDEKLAGIKTSIAESASVDDSVVISGPVVIGENAVIKAHTVIEGPCYIGPNTVIGANNVLRGPLNIEANVQTGAFLEIKHSVVQEGTHFHSGYIGDSVVGKNCRFGAGFVTANKRIDRANVTVRVNDEKIDSGMPALGIIAGNEVKIGIQAGSMPGVVMGEKAMVGPGTLLFNNVKSGTMVYEKRQQEER